MKKIPERILILILCIVLLGMSALADTEKDETVYVFAGADGAPYRIIVSDWLKNADAADRIDDVSALSGIFNVKGNETWHAGENGGIVWKADGRDIYYQGESSEEPPVTLEIGYTLNGASVSAGELRGQSGKVVIRYDYINHTMQETVIDGETQTVCVPFIAVTGMILDNEVFRNVEVENGILLNDGERSYVIGFGFPGLQQTLQPEAFELPASLIITADAEDLALDMTLTVIDNELTADIDLNDLAKMINDSDALGILSGDLAGTIGNLFTRGKKNDSLTQLVNKLVLGAKTLKSITSSALGSAEKAAGETAAAAEDADALKEDIGSASESAERLFALLLGDAQQYLANAGIEESLTRENYVEVLSAVGAPETDSIREALAETDALCIALHMTESSASSVTAEITTAARDAAAAQTAFIQLQNTVLGVCDPLIENGQSVASQLRAMFAAAKAYRNYSGIAADMTGRVRFICRVDEIR